MDRISFLPDDVVFKILSFVPTKVVVSTNLLSKRWRYLWKHVPKLEYLDPFPDTEYWRTSRFVDRFLLLHKALVLETLHLTLSRNCPSIDIETWISVAISRGVRNLHIFQHRPGSGPIRLPRSLYTCETLVALDLQPEVIIVGDVPFKIYLLSLKVLVFTLVKFSSVEILHKLLSGCPVLEKLTMVRGDDNMKSFTIAVPSLQRLIAVDCRSQVPGDDVGFVIKAPSLKFLFILSRCCGFRSLVDMPDLVKAYIKLGHGDPKKFMGCLTSIKSLYVCLQPQLLDSSCPIGVFSQLVSLHLCTCSLDWCRLILRHASKLRVLRFEQKEVNSPIQRCCSCSIDVQTQWEQPSPVPQCLISTLETVEWIDYKGTQVEKKVVMYLLENSRQLKTMDIRSLKSTSDNEKLKMLQELSSTHRISTKCGLSFT